LGDLFRNREEAGDSLEQFQQMYRRQLSGEANESGRLITVAEIYRTILPNLTAAVSARSADDSVGSQTVANLPSPVSPRNPPAIIVGGRRRAGGKRRRRSRSSRPDLLQLLSKRGNQRRRVHTVPSASWYVASAPAPTVIMEAEAEIETRTNMANKISSLLISLETDTDAWRELQFLHLHNFSKYLCTNCSQRFCFQCNEPEWHSGHTCIEWMAECVRRHEAGSSIEAANEGSTEEELDVAATAAPTDMGAVDSSSSSLNSEGEISGPSNTALDLIATYKWKLNNSKNCPRCWTIINREEGCNKVDCLMCGNRFCWVCLSPWSEKCGFYRCHTEPLTPLSPGTDASKESQMQQQNQQEQITDTQSITDDNSKPELGVPDVSAIHSRRASAIPQQTG
jgi:hypothetical protein